LDSKLLRQNKSIFRSVVILLDANMSPKDDLLGNMVVKSDQALNSCVLVVTIESITVREANKPKDIAVLDIYFRILSF